MAEGRKTKEAKQNKRLTKLAAEVEFEKGKMNTKFNLISSLIDKGITDPIELKKLSDEILSDLRPDYEKKHKELMTARFSNLEMV